jgi:hypothetical protein
MGSKNPFTTSFTRSRNITPPLCKLGAPSTWFWKDDYCNRSDPRLPVSLYFNDDVPLTETSMNPRARPGKGRNGFLERVWQTATLGVVTQQQQQQLTYIFAVAAIIELLKASDTYKPPYIIH